MVVRNDDGDIVQDMKGPAKKPMRTAVRVRDRSNFENGAKRCQMTRMDDKVLKNASADDVDNLALL